MRVQVPGKLVLVGEYAVVDGGPALVMAVPWGVACERQPAPTLTLLTPDGDDRFVRAALSAVGAPAARYRFTAHPPLQVDGPPLSGKPGFGGSAAAVVAALLAGGFAGDRDQLTALAAQVHHQVQGSGSGVDVAASAHGGMLRFAAGAVRPVQVPVPLAIWSGASARTGPRVQAWRALTDREPFLAASAGWVDALPSDPVGVAREAWRGLCAMAQRAGIAYRTPAIDQIVALVEAHGGGAKPSGAGGGDCVLAWGAPDRLAPALRAAGFTCIPLQPAPGPDLPSA